MLQVTCYRLQVPVTHVLVYLPLQKTTLLHIYVCFLTGKHINSHGKTYADLITPRDAWITHLDISTAYLDIAVVTVRGRLVASEVVSLIANWEG